jgi:uncharacterized membrane protein YozB (DUF420 family)
MLDDATLAATSAVFNVASTTLLILGRAAAKSGLHERHRKIMTAAIVTSALFLIAYASRWVAFEPRKFAGDGVARIVYLTILIPHMILAMAVPYVALRAAFLGRAGRLEAHVKLVRWGWPVWLFVSVTGVIVYGFLYHWPA